MIYYSIESNNYCKTDYSVQNLSYIHLVQKNLNIDSCSYYNNNQIIIKNLNKNPNKCITFNTYDERVIYFLSDQCNNYHTVTIEKGYYFLFDIMKGLCEDKDMISRRFRDLLQYTKTTSIHVRYSGDYGTYRKQFNTLYLPWDKLRVYNICRDFIIEKPAHYNKHLYLDDSSIHAYLDEKYRSDIFNIIFRDHKDIIDLFNKYDKNIKFQKRKPSLFNYDSRLVVNTSVIELFIKFHDIKVLYNNKPVILNNLPFVFNFHLVHKEHGGQCISEKNDIRPIVFPQIADKIRAVFSCVFEDQQYIKHINKNHNHWHRDQIIRFDVNKDKNHTESEHNYCLKFIQKWENKLQKQKKLQEKKEQKEQKQLKKLAKLTKQEKQKEQEILIGKEIKFLKNKRHDLQS